jgi:hypothetical protein
VNNVLQAAAEIQDVCLAENWEFAFIGGIAVLRWGAPRETVDADLTLMTGFGGEEPFVRILLQHFEARISDAEQFARDQRVLLLRSQSGVGLDVSLGALPYEERLVQRSSNFAYAPSISLRVCSAEDLIVLKTFAGRGQDWVDVERVIEKQTGKLDWIYIEEQLGQFAALEDTRESIDRLAHLRNTLDH